MKIRIYDAGENWTIEFTHGVQTFSLDYEADDEESAEWMAEQLQAMFYKYKMETIKEFFDFVAWYSGMEQEKIKRAYDRYLKEKIMNYDNRK